ncbi:MAG: MBL fold metallo-hydrolase [Endomicrobium sp.]|uniref:MBL fold metallo-hydrolase n=1 Tax=Candidatus Endomicrobiellum pyrsonymphae TaxID=1408203 RepID=UPI003579AA6D|nr:MBL fold metallo-hydrolase [Endomicrobium sp.]
MIKIKKILSGSLDENCYVVYDSETLHAAIIDPGEDGDKVILEIEKDRFNPEILINTHGHFDHILSDDKIRSKFKIQLAIHENDVSLLLDSYKNGSDLCNVHGTVKSPDILLEDNQEIKLSFATFKVLHTPGHTKGSICLLFDGFLITGDTLFAGTVGRTDLDGGSSEEMFVSLSKLKKLNPSLVIYPGHGSETTLANELNHNPYLRD